MFSHGRVSKAARLAPHEFPVLNDRIITQRMHGINTLMGMPES
jgi:hypothetical protein